MTLSIYLHYDGNCREAFEFYRSVFGGDFDVLTTFGEGPPDMEVPEEERDNVMHVSYRIGASVLMGSDVPSQFGPPPTTGNNFSISYTAGSREETDALFAKVSEAGPSRCRSRICSGEITSAPAPTNSASTGCSATRRSRRRSRSDSGPAAG